MRSADVDASHTCAHGVDVGQSSPPHSRVVAVVVAYLAVGRGEDRDVGHGIGVALQDRRRFPLTEFD